MIIGIGTDIIEIDRIEKAINDNNLFLSKVFTETELQQYAIKRMRIESIAGNFAVKEAVSKAIGTGFKGFNLKDIEVFRDLAGKPIIKIGENVKEFIQSDNYKFHVSISHNRSDAIAYVILEGI